MMAWRGDRGAALSRGRGLVPVPHHGVTRRWGSESARIWSGGCRITSVTWDDCESVQTAAVAFSGSAVRSCTPEPVATLSSVLHEARPVGCCGSREREPTLVAPVLLRSLPRVDEPGVPLRILVPIVA